MNFARKCHHHQDARCHLFPPQYLQPFSNLFALLTIARHLHTHTHTQLTNWQQRIHHHFHFLTNNIISSKSISSCCCFWPIFSPSPHHQPPHSFFHHPLLLALLIDWQNIKVDWITNVQFIFCLPFDSVAIWQPTWHNSRKKCDIFSSFSLRWSHES